MTATQLAPRRNKARNSRHNSTRPVPELLLEIAYLLHARKVVSRPRIGGRIALNKPVIVSGQ